MNDLTPWIVLFILLVFAAILGAVFRAKPDQELKRFAADWQGRILPGGFFEPPGVTFRIDDLRASIDYTLHGDEATRTHLTVPLANTRLRLELRPQTIARQLGKYLGMEDLEIGDHDFDAAFIIQGSNRALITEFLTQSVREAIMQVAHCGASNNIFDLHLVISGGTLRVTKHQHLTTEVDLSRFATACRDLLRAIRQAAQAGIEFVATPQPRPVEETECQVCGDPLREKIVYCPKCKTPHHLDCWQYFGSCAIYGCGQKRFSLR